MYNWSIKLKMLKLDQKGFIIAPILAWTLLVVSGLFVGTVAVKERLITFNLSSNQPSGEVSSATTEATAKNLPSPTQTPEPTTNSDPVIECQNSNCGPIKIKRSLCSNTTGYVCCQVGNTWTWYASRDKCSQDQNAQQPKNRQMTTTTTDTDPIVICKGKTGERKVPKSVCNSYTECPDGYGGYIFESQESCKKRLQKYGQDLADVIRQWGEATLEEQRLKNQLRMQQWESESKLRELETRKKMDDLIKSIPEPNFSVPPLPTIAPSTPKPTPNYTCPGGGCWTKGSDLFTSPSLFGM